MTATRKMAPKDKDQSKKSKKASGQGKDKERSLKDVASGFVDEVEKTGAALIDEVKQLFDSLSHKVSGVAGAAVESSTALAQKVGKEPAQFVGSLIKEVQEAGEASVKAIGESFQALRGRVGSHTGEEPAGQTIGNALDTQHHGRPRVVAHVLAVEAEVRSP